MSLAWIIYLGFGAFLALGAFFARAVYYYGQEHGKPDRSSSTTANTGKHR